MAGGTNWYVKVLIAVLGPSVKLEAKVSSTPQVVVAASEPTGVMILAAPIEIGAKMRVML